MKPTSPTKGPALDPAAALRYTQSCRNRFVQDRAGSKTFPPLEPRHPCEEHRELPKWNLSFSIKSCCITLAANPCNKAADAPNTDLIYHFKQPEQSHHNEKSGLETGKIPRGTNKNDTRADRRVFSAAGRREMSVPFHGSEGRARWCRSNAGRSDNQIRSRARGDTASSGTEKTVLQREREGAGVSGLWNQWNKDK